MVTKSDIRKMVKYGEIYLDERFQTKILCVGCRGLDSIGSFWQDLTKYFEHIEQLHWNKNGTQKVTHIDFLANDTEIEVSEERIIDLTGSDDEEDVPIIKSPANDAIISIETEFISIKTEKTIPPTSQNGTEKTQGDNTDELERQLSIMFEEDQETNSKEKEEPLQSINNSEVETQPQQKQQISTEVSNNKAEETHLVNTQELLQELANTPNEFNSFDFQNKNAPYSVIPTPEASPIENRYYVPTQHHVEQHESSATISGEQSPAMQTTNTTNSTLQQLLSRPSPRPQMRESVITSVASLGSDHDEQTFNSIFNRYEQMLESLGTNVEIEAPDTQCPTQFSTTQQNCVSSAPTHQQSWQQNSIYGRIQSFDTVNAYVTTTLPDNTERNLFPVRINTGCNQTSTSNTTNNNFMVNSLPVSIPLNQLSTPSILQQQQNMQRTEANRSKQFSYRDYRHQKQQSQQLLPPSYDEHQNSLRLNSNSCCNYRLQQPTSMQQHSTQSFFNANNRHMALNNFVNRFGGMPQEQNFSINSMASEKSPNKSKNCQRRRKSCHDEHFRCLQCPMKPTFMSRANFELHDARFHNPSLETTYCEVCKRRFMNQHMEKHKTSQAHNAMLQKLNHELTSGRIRKRRKTMATF